MTIQRITILVNLALLTLGAYWAVNTFYKVLVVTEQDHFSQKSNRYDLFPGMRVVVGIHIGRRSVLGYFLDPFIDAMSGSMHER